MSGKKSSSGSGCLMLFALPFMAVGIGAGYFLLSTVFEAVMMREWVAVPATVIATNLETSRGSKGSTTYKVTATYEYDFAGSHYSGDRVSLSAGSDNVGSFHQEKYDELSAHKENGIPVTAYVDPGDPSQSILYRELRLGMVILFGMFALMFGGAGFGLFSFGLIHGRSTRTEKKLSQLNPGQPWLHREDWKSRKIKSGTGTQAAIVIVLAIFFSLVTLPVLFLVPGEVMEEGNYAALIALIFPAIGLVLDYWAIVLLSRYLKFNNTYFEIQTLSAYLGEKLGGSIKSSVQLPSEPNLVVLKLICNRTTISRSGGKTTYSTNEIFKEERKATPQRSASGSSIPVDFPLPETAEPTYDGDNGSVSWQLEASADLPGANFSATFDVPIYKRS